MSVLSDAGVEGSILIVLVRSLVMEVHIKAVWIQSLLNAGIFHFVPDNLRFFRIPRVVLSRCGKLHYSKTHAFNNQERCLAMTEKATFAAGCFWGVESAFRSLDGVTDTMVGYTGGVKENPTYQEVCTDTTGHAEAVEVTYDPDKIAYEQLLNVFWSIHDPTTLNRQGPDTGSQYRSAIFVHSPQQEQLAQASKAQLEASGRLHRPVVTQIAPATVFYKAEEYHQQYDEKHGRSCHI